MQIPMFTCHSRSGSCKCRTKEGDSQDPEVSTRWRIFKPFWIPMVAVTAGRMPMQMWSIWWAHWAVLWR